MIASPENARDIFLAAVKLSPDQWDAFVNTACGNDETMRNRVQKLLKAHLDAGSFLDVATIEHPDPEQVLSELPGTRIGNYKILQQIGEGGMGVVYMAEQTEPVHRKVALKVIKPGMDSRQVIARFEAERQTLAMMDHVNIARVIDGGTTESGRPYFVMELVNGVPITKYCDDNHLTPRERLELFIPVCQAIQHAHQKGIIHRDIKPSNVMVTLYDGKPVPKVIDFGVAKAIDQKMTDSTLFTNIGTMVGTLEYMSPEQADSNALGIDTRSDIYSLGVLLYELLTGSTPLTRKQFKEAANYEILRMIKEEEPQKPSTRLSESGDALASISAQRKMEPAKLSKLVRGELDWIVMKTLEKDRNRRYETASGLAVDVQRYLNDEAVLACPPSRGYRVRKFVRRNKGAVIAAAVVFVSLVGGVVGTTAGLFEANRQRDIAQVSEKLAKEEAAIANAISDFLRIDLLEEAAPEQNARSKNITIEKLLDRASKKIEGKFKDQARVEAAIRQTIGYTYRQLGNFKAAEPHLKSSLDIRTRVFGEDHDDTITARNNLGILYQAMAQYDVAEKLFLINLNILRPVSGKDDDLILKTLNNLAVIYQAQGNSIESEKYYNEAMTAHSRKNGENNQFAITIMNNLAVLLLGQARYSDAEEQLKKALEISRRILGDNDPDTLHTIYNLAYMYLEINDTTRALQLLEKNLQDQRHVLGSEHPDTLATMSLLGQCYCVTGNFKNAEALLVEALESGLKVLNEDHSHVSKTLGQLGRLYQNQGKLDRAESSFKKALDIDRRTKGEEHSNTLALMSDLGMLYGDQGKYDSSEALLTKAMELSRKVNGVKHMHTLIYTNYLGSTLWRAKKFDKSVPLFSELVKTAESKCGKTHSMTVKAMANLGVNIRDAGQVAKGISIIEKAWELSHQPPASHDRSLMFIRTALIESYDLAGQHDKAEPFYLMELEAVKEQQGADSMEYANVLAAVALNLLKQNKYSKVESYLRHCLRLREQSVPDDWRTFNTKSMLGGSLLGQKKYTQAEQLLIDGYEGMMHRLKLIPVTARPRLGEALDRIVKLYESTGQSDKAESWRKKMTTAKSSKQMEVKKD